MAVEGSPSIAKVAFRPPPFWDADPELWFAQVESQFQLAGISADITKFHAVISVLSPKILSVIKDIVIEPPASKAYETIKQQVLGHFAQSASVRLRQLISEIQLGDMKPSQLLVHMKNIAPENIDREMLQTLWLQKLPVNTQQILSSSKGSLDDLANIADKIHEVSGFQDPPVASVAKTDEVSALRNEVRLLTEAVQELKRQRAGSSRRRRSRYRGSQQRNRYRGNTNGELCWYHGKFGKKASKCVKPCSFQGNEDYRQ